MCKGKPWKGVVVYPCFFRRYCIKPRHYATKVTVSYQNGSRETVNVQAFRVKFSAHCKLKSETRMIRNFWGIS